MKKPPGLKLILILVGLGALIVLAIPLVIFRDVGLICETCGTRYGHREWLLGVKTHAWTNTTAIDDFARKNHHALPPHRWVSYMGTGRNLFGMKVLHGHGRPNALIHVRPEILNPWFNQLPVAEQERVYQIFVFGEKQAIAAKIQRIWDWQLSQ